MTDDGAKILGTMIGGPLGMGIPQPEEYEQPREPTPELPHPHKKQQQAKPPPVIKENKRTTIKLMNRLRDQRESANKTTPVSLTNINRLYHLNQYHKADDVVMRELN